MSFVRLIRKSKIIFFAALLLTGCGAAVQPIVPTARPSVTPTSTYAPTRTPGYNATPTILPTALPMTATGGPSPTPLFAPTSTLIAAAPTNTRVPNPNGPRIEFFTTDVLAVAPGTPVNLFWSTRGSNTATIYRLDRNGVRNQLWNVPPDGSLAVNTRRSERGQISFVLSVGDGPNQVEQTLEIPLACPDTWFFPNAPTDCPDGPAEETSLAEEPFERGRMLYIQSTNNVYALFNDGRDPAWVAFTNRFDPAVHPELEESFVPPPGYYQPLRILGFVWRGNDLVRNRLGLALQPEFSYDGFVQLSTSTSGAQLIYASSADGTVLQLLPEGDSWQIITPP